VPSHFVFFALHMSQLVLGRFFCGICPIGGSVYSTGCGTDECSCTGRAGAAGAGGGGGRRRGGAEELGNICDGGSTCMSSRSDRRLCARRSLSSEVLDNLGGSGRGSGWGFFLFVLGTSGSSLLNCLDRLASLTNASGSFSSRYFRRLESLRGGGARSSYVL
jgi:hypothetical protein